MGCYYTLCHNTYAYSLLFYKVYIRRENAGSWNSRLEKEQILETYSAQLQKSWKFTEDIFRIYKNTQRKRFTRGATPCPRGWGRALGGQARPPPSWARCGPPGELLALGIFYIFWKRLPWSFRTFGAVHNRSLIFAPFPAHNPSCRHSPSLCKPCKIRENRHKYCDIMCNNSP